LKEAMTKKATEANPAEAPTFSAALTELEEILGRLENEEIDIDALATELHRGTELLDLCRSKIRKAEVEVTQIVQRLEEPEEDGVAAVDPYGEDDEIPF
jgi:exodeoxyribonuclease VII small subunit